MRELLDDSWELPGNPAKDVRARHLIRNLETLPHRTAHPEGEFGATAWQLILQLIAAIEAYLSATVDAAEAALVAAIETQRMKGEESVMYDDGAQFLSQHPDYLRPRTLEMMQDEMSWREKSMRVASGFDGADFAEMRGRR